MSKPESIYIDFGLDDEDGTEYMRKDLYDEIYWNLQWNIGVREELERVLEENNISPLEESEGEETTTVDEGLDLVIISFSYR